MLAADGAVRWSHVLTFLEDTEDWNKEKWIGRSQFVLLSNHHEYCEDQHGTIIYIRALQVHSHGVAINPQPVLHRYCRIEKKNTLSTRAALPTTSPS